ncbi:MAG: 23S rRNA (pseudouridine(1915)-N(3))-methyltransferase RlmH [Lachnospiraceae bacterium]|nr:23S rRNA (pseudouridine(1915)-N(3))-methyltransferase RlmH [Lachnospiraceae bacterium]
MIYRILCIGKIKDGYYREAIAELEKNIHKMGNRLEIVEFPDLRIPDRMREENREAFLKKECSRMMEQIRPTDYVVALCIEGKELTTEQHGEYVRRAAENGYTTVTYVIGGSLGLPETLKKRSHLKLSFSRMTFPHQMMRMVLCEEIANL